MQSTLSMIFRAPLLKGIDSITACMILEAANLTIGFRLHSTRLTRRTRSGADSSLWHPNFPTASYGPLDNPHLFPGKLNRRPVSPNPPYTPLNSIRRFRPKFPQLRSPLDSKEIMLLYTVCAQKLMFVFTVSEMGPTKEGITRSGGVGGER